MGPCKGYPKGYHCGSRAPTNSSSCHAEDEPPTSRVQQEAYNATTNFQENTPQCFQAHLQDVEAEVSIEKTMTIDSKVVEATIRWVPNVGNTRA
jgi:hypothetical protein